MKIEAEKCSIFLISVGRLFSYEKKLLLCLVAFNYKHDGYGNPGKKLSVFLAIHHSLLVQIMTSARVIMQQDEADERVGTRILEFPKQFIVNATGNRQIAQKRFLKIRGRKRLKPV